MTASTPERRTKSAKELAEQFGISERHVRRLIAEPRSEYLERAAARRAKAAELRKQGLKLKDIAEEMGCTVGTVGRLLHDVRKYEQQRQAAKSADPDQVVS
ncbi:helix-turn-helix domain-containing protein [Actinomadura kijaniata]|uniref:helix-turn-helix domain-containing protein n=1 Tax=Actinomadura kijaniata TaxID=46161 RepID=UPI00082CE21E|nr:helix-turn-helix domain-containing protein [Actinomadura kijaniata]